MTVIASDGRVLLDSKADAGELENHYTRGEVIGAFETGEGFELRYSKTLEAWQVYSARKSRAARRRGVASCACRTRSPRSRR